MGPELAGGGEDSLLNFTAKGLQSGRTLSESYSRFHEGSMVLISSRLPDSQEKLIPSEA